MFHEYTGFFAASAGAAAAFIGLLFVALSFIDGEDADTKDRTWRRIMASSSFSQLTNVFFVSMVGLTPDARNVAIAGVVMSALGLLISLKLLPQTLDTPKTGQARPSVLGLFAVGAYVIEFVACVYLLHSPNDPNALRLLVLTLFMLYAGALARAWEIAGIKRR